MKKPFVLFKKFMDNPLLFGIFVTLGFMGLLKLASVILGAILRPFLNGQDAEVILNLVLIIIFVCLYTWYITGYRKEVPHTLSVKTFFKGIRLLLPMLIIAVVFFLISLLAAFAGDGNLPDVPYVLRACISALEAGVCEDIAIRGLFAGNAMRVKHEPKDVLKYAVISSIVFGLVHIINLASGASVSETISQVFYATGFGMILCAAFYRTGTIFPCIIVHFLFDFLQMVSMSVINGTSDKIGVMTGAGQGSGIEVGKIIYGIATLVIFGLIGLHHLRKEKRDEIVSIFNVSCGG